MEIFAEIGVWSEMLAGEIDAAELETTARVLRRVGDKLMGVIEVPSDPVG